MSDDPASQNSEYGNIPFIRGKLDGLTEIVAQIKADLFKLQKAVADLEAKTEPLQAVTNALNVVAQLEMNVDGLNGRYQVALGAARASITMLIQRMDALEAKVGAMETALANALGGAIQEVVDERIAGKLGALEQRIAAMETMGKIGQ